MNVSLISTVYNEENSIEKWLESIINQSQKPDEFVIVDGGSTDKTVEIIKKYSKKYPWIKVIVKKGANIAEGRNVAIEHAKNEIIAVTDAGCIVDKKWLEEITKPFGKGFDVVSGVYKAYYENIFEKIQGMVVVTPIEKQNTISRMSSRSIAFKKTCWKKAGKYPTKTLTGEDTLFNIKLKQNNCKFFHQKNAIVYWKMRPTLKTFIKQFYKYGYGDGKLGNIFKMKLNLIFVLFFILYFLVIISSTFMNTKLAIIALILIILYMTYNGIKYAIKSKSIKGAYYGVTLPLLKRVSYVIGTLVGIKDKLIKSD